MKMKHSLKYVFASLLCILTIESCNKEDIGGNSGEQPDVLDEKFFDTLYESCLTELINYAKVPRPGFHLDRARAYIKAMADENGWNWERDDYGNCWFDVPATSGKESAPKIILQGHMDMVCASAEGETHDFLTEVGTPVRDNEFLWGEHINLGIDNAIGVGMMFSIVKSGIPHGPLRCLFTADEDQGMLGAKALSKDAIDSDYLISLDAENASNMYAGCAGTKRGEFTGSFNRMQPVTDESKITVSISGLLGGHSGININDHRLSAFVALRTIINEVVVPHHGHIIVVNSGIATNSIPTSGVLTFALGASEKDSAVKEIEAILNRYEEEYPEENIIRSVSTAAVASDDFLFDESFTVTMCSLLNSLVHGVIEMDAELANHVSKSNNVSPVVIGEGKMSVALMTRSDFNDWLSQINEDYKSTAAGLGLEYRLVNESPAWRSDVHAPLYCMLKRNYTLAGVNPVDYYSQGGVEPAIFSQLRESLQCCCFGPKIYDAHSINERLRLDTLKPVLKAVVNTLLKADEL